MQQKPVERRGDPRSLSDRKPGRSRIQDDVPLLPPRELVEGKDKDRMERGVSRPSPRKSDLERREARRRGAMPYGTRGSRRGRPLKGSKTQEEAPRPDRGPSDAG